MNRALPHLTRRQLARPLPLKSRPEEFPRTITPRMYAERSLYAIRKGVTSKRPLALVISAYNESLVLEHTLRSAIAAGLPAQDIYVVDDCSKDGTDSIARRVIGSVNVFRVSRSGKGLAIHKISSELHLAERYNWIHIADADGEFDTEYFEQLYSRLDPKYAAATGYVESLPGSYISKYRAFEYTLGMDVTRRFQSMADVITIVPGPTSVFRSDVFSQLDFNANSLCEDFDVTLQIHRLGLGKIQFIDTAVARTQDPGTFKDFVKQILRWNRGVMQMFFKHKVGRSFKKVDSYLMYQLMQNLTFFMMYALWIPVMTVLTGSFVFLALAFLSDVLIVLGFVLFAQMRTGRRDLMIAFPMIYMLRWVSLGVFVKSFVEVFILGKYRLAAGTWETVTRRAHTH